MKNIEKKNIMNSLHVVPMFACCVALSWFIIYEIIIATYIDCPLKIQPYPGMAIMKAENDTTDYYKTLKNSDCFCEKVHCARRCCKEGKCNAIKKKKFSNFFPFFITENVTLDKLCPSHSNTSSRFTIPGAYLEKGSLIYDNGNSIFVLEHDNYCVSGKDTFGICSVNSENTVYIAIGKSFQWFYMLSWHYEIFILKMRYFQHFLL